MPLPEELRSGLDSKVADLANVTGERTGGMLVAGLFLREFVADGVAWAHVDVAGPAMNTSKPWGFTPKGATGVPVRTLLATLEDIAEKGAEVGHCVHRLAQHPSRPDTLFMQKHWDVLRTDDAGANWREVSGDLPTDFGFPIAVHAHEPETIYVVPITSDSLHYVMDGKLRVYRSRTGGEHWEPLTAGLPQENCYVNVLRDAMAVDTLESCGIYFGTSGGQVYGSSDSGDTWRAIVRDLPPVLSVEAQVLP